MGAPCHGRATRSVGTSTRHTRLDIVYTRLDRVCDPVYYRPSVWPCRLQSTVARIYVFIVPARVFDHAPTLLWGGRRTATRGPLSSSRRTRRCTAIAQTQEQSWVSLTWHWKMRGRLSGTNPFGQRQAIPSVQLHNCLTRSLGGTVGF